MDFELSDDERSLADGVRRLCAARFPLEALRAQEGRRTLDGAGWRALGEAGVFALTVPEEDGGLGLGRAHLAVVFEELGRALVPGPLAASAAAAPVVKGAADGAVPVGLLWRAPGDARPVLVADVASLGALVVVGGDGAALVDPADL
ncbi:MAG TPA: acyl-CoA dehydrogenase family protein, partial [Acidimicrobiales bacterium]|nr:acyl-CoA dehydrogenase family protein [Acidimicrobiales bacterium]